MARQYKRDARGRFASGGTLGARASLRKSRQKLAANPTPAQKAAVTRGNKKLREAKKDATVRFAGRRGGTIARPKGYVRPGAKPEAVASKPATKAAAKAVARARGTLAARASLRASQAKLAGKPTAAQKGAVTRGKKKLQQAKKESTVRIAGRRGGTIGRPKGYVRPESKGKPSVSGVEAIPRGDLKRYRLLQNKIKPLRDSLDRDGSRMIGSTDWKFAERAAARYDLNNRKLNRIMDTMRRLSNSPDSPNVPRLPRVKTVGPRVGRTAAIRKMDGPRKRGRQSWRDLKGQYFNGRVRYEDNYMNKLHKRKNKGDTVKGPRIAGVIKPRSRPAKPPAPTGSRTRKQAVSAQRRRREWVLKQTRRGLYGRNPRIRAVDTGIRQLSLVGKPKTIKTYKPVRRR